MTRLDAGMEAHVGTQPLGTKLGGIPPAGIFGVKWAVAASMVEVVTSEVTVLVGGVVGVGKA